MSNLEPSTPDPALVTLVMALIRSILQLFSGIGIGVGLVLSDAQLMLISGAIITIVTLTWSIYQKIAAARREDMIARINASAPPAAPPVQPPAPTI
jgi:hypothetical protein